MTAWLDDGDVRLYHGDAVDVLRQLPAGSVQTCITSPPYWGLRSYLDDGHADKSSELGLEPTPGEYVANIVAVFVEVWRVLRDDGTCWINLGDSYNAGTSSARVNHFTPNPDDTRSNHFAARSSDTQRRDVPGLKAKDLVGIPWRVAFALQEAGWYLRSDIIWAKPNPMPESVTDRPTKAHEMVFLLSKSARYFYDMEAVREPHSPDGRTKTVHDHATPNSHPNYDSVGNGNERWPNGGRNMRSVWEIPTQPTPEAHFATFPEALVRRCIQAGSSEHGECSACGAPWHRQVEREQTKPGEAYESRLKRSGADFTPRNQPNRDREQVPTRYNISQSTAQTTGWQPSCTCDAPVRAQTILDPFIGSGTTALVARRLGRRAIGIDLSAAYLDIARRRTQQLSLLA